MQERSLPSGYQLNRLFGCKVDCKRIMCYEKGMSQSECGVGSGIQGLDVYLKTMGVEYPRL